MYSPYTEDCVRWGLLRDESDDVQVNRDGLSLEDILSYDAHQRSFGIRSYTRWVPFCLKSQWMMEHSPEAKAGILDDIEGP